MVPRRPSRRLALGLTLLLFCTYLARWVSVDPVRRMMVKVKDVTTRPNLSGSSLLCDDAKKSLSQVPGSASKLEESDGAMEFVKDEGSQTSYSLRNTSPYPHLVLFSTSTKNREYMRVYFGGVSGNNINIISHPNKAEFWILVAQREQQYTPITLEQNFTALKQGASPSKEQQAPSEQVACTAGIQSDAVICAQPASPVPFMGPQLEGVCLDDIAFLTLVLGARDSRVFWGPDIPYMVYGAKAKHICIGQWLQDARYVLSQFRPHRHMVKDKPPFRSAAELPRPSGGGVVEKNYFLFWDPSNVPYVHYTLWPKRAFSRLNDDGTGSADLASATEYHDQICMAKFMPPVKNDGSIESIHQATNSLAITMCQRSDQLCRPDDSNTFIMHLFHHKTYKQYHAVYEPYVILFQRHAPFAIHAIGQRPYWIHGRHNLTEATESSWYKNSGISIPEGHTEMFYITSMNWKSHLQKHHGYMDDVLFISFGIEDTRPGIIDIVAGDLFDDLAYG